MSVSRLNLSLESGLVALPPEGRILLLRPRAGQDLSDLPKDRLLIVQGFRPDHDAFAAQGYGVAAEAEGSFAAAIVFLPRARAEARALIAEAAARVPAGAPIIIDGQKTDGIDACLREVRGRVAVGEALSKAHGKTFQFAAPGPEVFADWTAQAGQADGFTTLPGVFSADGIDRASALLAAALPVKLPRRIADLGAGWGYLSSAVLARTGVGEVHLIEADHAALECARLNITDPRARFHWADVTRFVPERRFDGIVMNPPFHSDRAADPGLGAAFIRAAARLLQPSGSLWMVANRHLAYERVLSDCFGEREELGADPGFKLYRCARPRPPARVGA